MDDDDGVRTIYGAWPGGEHTACWAIGRSMDVILLADHEGRMAGHLARYEYVPNHPLRNEVWR